MNSHCGVAHCSGFYVYLDWLKFNGHIINGNCNVTFTSEITTNTIGLIEDIRPFDAQMPSFLKLT